MNLTADKRMVKDSWMGRALGMIHFGQAFIANVVASLGTYMVLRLCENRFRLSLDQTAIILYLLYPPLFVITCYLQLT